MAKIANFAKNFNAVTVMFMACLVTLLTGCTQNDVGDEALRTKTEYGIDYKETSKLTPDNEYGTAVLHVELDKKIGSNVETRNADVQAKCIANVETDPVETSNMEKVFVSGDIIKNNIENSIAHTFTCDIAVNGTENMIKTKVTVTPDMAWDRSYDLNVTKIKVAADEVKIVPTSAKAGEKARQAISAPVDFTICTVGTEKDNAEDHTCVVRQIVVWEQYQLESTPEIVDGDIDSWTWIIGGWKSKYNVHWKNIWSDGNETFEDFPYEASYSGEAAALEDLFVKNWQKTLKNIEGLSVGTESKVKEEGYFTEYTREDIYAANHTTSSETTTKCVYFWRHPKVIFEKNGKKHVFDFVSPNFSENGNDLLDATSMKSGYDLKVFRNSVTVKYGNAETGVDEQVMEARQNLYKAAKAVKGVELISATTDYPSFAIDFTAKYRLIYNDDTKSDALTITTSRPWTLTYDGSWSMTAKGDVNQSTTAIVLTKGSSKTEEQTIANGKWVCTSTGFTADNNTTVDNQVQKNGWKMNIPTKMSLFLYDTEIPFEIAAPKAEAKDIKITLTNSSATSETYKFSENLNVTVGTDTEISEGIGTITKAVEVKVDSWEWKSDYSFTNDKLNAWVEKIYHMTDGSTKTIRREFTGTRGSNVYTYFETTEVNNSESTGAAQFSFNTQAVTDGDWSFNKLTGTLNFGVTYAGSEQKDGWNLIEYNNLSCTIEGDTYTFPAFEYNAQANASQSKTAETENRTEYTHTNAPTYNFGGYSMTLSAASGKIFVNKVVTPEHHNGYFPESYGKLEGDNKVACLNPSNFKDWGIGGSLKFTNGSLPYFITKDGVISFGTFEAGSTVWNGASPDGNGKLMNCDGKDASTAMKWRRDNTTINMLSYTDGKIMGFHNGNNTVVTSMFPGSIEQKDGGKWQSISFAGVRDAQGRTSFDTSF
jgi:hypothetical protein